MRAPIAILTAVAVLALAGCGSSGNDATTAATAAKTTATAAHDAGAGQADGAKTGGKTSAGAAAASGKAQASGDQAARGASAHAVCRKVSAPHPRPAGKLAAPEERLDPSKSYEVVFDTSCGRFAVALDVRRAPKTAASFASLVRRGFYDGTVIHRVVPDFVIQGGDPTQTGEGGPGYHVTEAPPSNLRYTRGVVAMAKTQADPPGRSGSQFYVVTGADAQLPPIYALVGRVSRGQAVVQAIGAQQTDPSTQRPVDPIVVRSARLVTR